MHNFKFDDEKSFDKICLLTSFQLENQNPSYIHEISDKNSKFKKA